jgi:hypothetical protein
MITSTTIDLVLQRKLVSNFFKTEKENGIKKAWYYYHHGHVSPDVQVKPQITALDTKEMFIEATDIYKSQGFVHTETICKDGTLGCKKVNMHVFRNIDETKRYAMDPLSLAFDYWPADCEIVIFEVWHVAPLKPQTQKKKKRK